MVVPNIVLMGLRASGKTSVGQLLATQLGRGFVDLDDVAAARLGCVDVPEAWARFGAEAFRAMETEALREVLVNGGQVVALGGGTPTAPGAEEVLCAATAEGSVRLVYLRARPDTLQRRLMLTDLSRRPSLTGDGVVEEVRRVFEARDAMYARIASRVLDVDGLGVEGVVARLASST